MNQSLWSYFKRVIIVEVTGKNINRFLTKIYQLPLNILSLNRVDRKTIQLRIFAEDYERLLRIKTVNEIRIIAACGRFKIKQVMRQNRTLLLTLVFGYVLLLVLSNLIFKIEVVHEQQVIRDLITKELSHYNVKRLRFKPSYERLEAIETLILKKYREQLEWLEIIEEGTKYIVKVEIRRIIKEKEEYKYQDVIAAKDAVLVLIEAEAGEILKKPHDYVRKGEIIISGKIKHNEKIMEIVAAKGKIWGEVWYNVKVELPLKRVEEKRTGLRKTVYSIRLLNWRLPLFDFKPYAQKIIQVKKIISNQLVPLQVVCEEQIQVERNEYRYNETEALLQAQVIATKKVKGNLEENEQIISSKPLKYHLENNKIFLEMFFKVYEDITMVQAFDESELEERGEDND